MWEACRQQLCKIDVLFFVLLSVYVFVDVFPDIFWSIKTFAALPRFAVEVPFLFSNGFLQRSLALRIVTLLDERGATRAMRERPLPHTLEDRMADLKMAMAKPWFHNKNAILMSLMFLAPMDLMAGHTVGTVTMTVKGMYWAMVLGLLVMDLILGTAHMVSHKGRLKPFLWPFHALHHTKHINYATVKFVGEPFDLEVFLTQASYAFLPRVLGLDVFTGAALIIWFDLQLLLEHTGYRWSSLAQHHSAHHLHGSVAFYHFPLVELFFGRMPTVRQLQELQRKRRAAEHNMSAGQENVEKSGRVKDKSETCIVENLGDTSSGPKRRQSRRFTEGILSLNAASSKSRPCRRALTTGTTTSPINIHLLVSLDDEIERVCKEIQPMKTLRKSCTNLLNEAYANTIELTVNKLLVNKIEDAEDSMVDEIVQGIVGNEDSEKEFEEESMEILIKKIAPIKIKEEKDN